MSSKKYKREDLRLTWRLLAAPGIGQIIGGLFGLLIPFDSIQFMSVWIGGASGTFVGFWVGVWWHFKDIERKKKVPYFTLIFIGLISNSFGVAVFFMTIGNISSTSLLNKMASIEPTDLSEIIILDEHDNEIIAVIKDKDILSEFAVSCCDVSKYHPIPNDDSSITFSCFVDLSGAFLYNLEVDFYEGQDNRIIGAFVKREGRKTFYHGTFVSNNLRKWFEQYVVPDTL